MSKQELCEPIWSEGMFLTPHHLQYLHRYRSGREWSLTSHLAPYPWGFKALDLETSALGEFVFRVKACRAVLPGGLVLAAPGNADIASRSFKEMMPAGGGGMMVYLGVPELKADQPNLRNANHAAEAAYNPRYIPAEIEELDANTGEHARKILVQRLRCRLFFGDEDRAGYDCLAAARVMPAPGGAGAVLDPNYLPPALTMGAWEPLQALGQDVSSRVQATLGALRQAAGSEEIGDILGSSRGLEFGFKHLALAGSAQVIGQMAQTPAMQPHAVYLELARLLGALTIFAGDARLQSAPPYDHNDLGGCFGRIKQALEALLERLASPSYLRRSFKLRKDRLEVDLEPDWVSGRRRLFLGVSGSDDPETMAGKAAGLKICAPRDREEILHRRLGAIPIEWLRTAPPPLPGRGKTLYGRIAAGGPFWAGVQEDMALVLMGSESLPYRYDLYIV